MILNVVINSLILWVYFLYFLLYLTMNSWPDRLKFIPFSIINIFTKNVLKTNGMFGVDNALADFNN